MAQPTSAPRYWRAHRSGLPVGISFPGPDTFYQLYPEAAQQSYLDFLVSLEGNMPSLLDQFAAPQAIPLLVPIVHPNLFVRWAAQQKLDPRQPATRAQWGATRIHDQYDQNTRTVRGSHPYQTAGDMLAIGLALLFG